MNRNTETTRTLFHPKPVGHGPRLLLTSIAMVLLIFGLGGFGCPKILSTYLTPARCFLGLFCEALSLLVAGWASGLMIRLFSLFWVAAFGAFAWAGMARGVPGTRQVGTEMFDAKLLVLLPGHFEFIANDHRIHAVLSMLFLVTAILPKSWDK